MTFLFAGALVLAACGDTGATPSAEESADGSAPAESQPAESAGTITVVIDGQLTTLSNAANDLPTAEANEYIYNGLYQYDLSLAPIPDLTDGECEVSEDGTIYTCTLQAGLTFHDGSPVTAEDVAFVYDMAHADNCRLNASICIPDFLADAEAVDDVTVEFTLTQPYAPFVTTMLPGVGIESKAVIEAAYTEFQGATEALDAADVQAVADVLAEVTAAEDTTTPEAQAACDAELAGAEELLTTIGTQIPNREDFNVLEDGSFDACAFATDLQARVANAATSLAAEGEEAIAAAYPLLSFNFDAPVGTGPWMCEAGCVEPGQGATLTAFEGYVAGPPATETLELRIITDDVTGANALASGEVDWKYSLTQDAYNGIAENPDLQFAEYPDFGYFGLQYNLREGRLFADKNLRLAVQLCIDKPETVNIATNGGGVPIEADIPPASWAFNDQLTPVERDTEAAIALLEESGWTVTPGQAATKGDQTLSTDVYVRAGRPDRIAFMELTRDQVIECGIEFNVIPGDFATVLLPLLDYPNDFDAYFGGWSTGYEPDPFSLWHSSQCTTPELPSANNYICFQNDEADQLISDGLVESDQDARAEIYQRFEEILYEEQPYLFAWSDLAHEGLNGTMTSTSGELDLSTPEWHWELETLTVAE